MSGDIKYRTITIYKQYFPEFFAKQRQKVKDKIIWTLKLIEEVQFVPETYLKHLEGTAGLFEIRVQAGSDILEYFVFLTRGN
ncbi:type II toxin-antitoxin system RelE/ParE family toxin [Arcticibacter tournemirensis]|uniref:type II toxin-antitoxin system RelE/ParE family toxin n=1 Tax=Arcticibacter tournemirensis TaxID=699437 RepID=UPI001F1B0508|nr:type II toxin-antitoxin system RelE/ParE family toxin [Arcticibacter tournemirensis]